MKTWKLYDVAEKLWTSLLLFKKAVTFFFSFGELLDGTILVFHMINSELVLFE